ncbi:MAG: glycerol-3-phosphate 1-O-acyltransferase PlsY [Tunicatimonas sp.]
MQTLLIFSAIVVAYLLGSIPTAVWYSRRFFDIDVRDYGSGNAGATNTFRVLGKRAGTVVLLIDILKGSAATMLAFALLHTGAITPSAITEYKLLLGLVAVMGHVFPVYTNFRGGKGVATLLGMTLSAELWVALVCVGIFLIMLYLTKYVSLSALLATLSFPLLVWLVPPFVTDEPLLIVFGFVMFAVLAFTHKKNIVRLVHGTESRTYLFSSRRG